MNLVHLQGANASVVCNSVSNYNITLQAQLTESPDLQQIGMLRFLFQVCAAPPITSARQEEVPADRPALNFEGNTKHYEVTRRYLLT